MKRIHLLTAVTLLSFASLRSQDYQTVFSDRVACFQNKNKYVECIRIDSVNYQTDSVFYPFSNIQELDDDCFTPSGPSWIGKKLMIQNNGYNLFFNKNNDTIKIKTNALLNESWTAYELPDSTVITARVLKHDTSEFLGQLDSVKTIGFQVYTKNMTPVTHPLNDMTLLLSKNFGLIKTFNFYLFPGYEINFPDYYLQEYNLTGLSKPQIGIQNLTRFDVFDFQPGDEIHVLYEESRWGTGDDYSITQKTITKYLTRADYPDSIVYSFDIKSNRNTIRTDATLFSYLHDIRKSVIVPDTIFDKLPGEPIRSEYEAYSYVMYNNGTISKTEPSGYDRICSPYNDSCWMRCDVWGCWPSYSYIKGLGGPYYECDDFFFGFIKENNELVYYKKGDLTSGTPLIVTDTNNVVLEEETEVFPNPAKDILWIKTLNNYLPLVFELIDINGKSLFQKSIVTVSTTINLGSFPAGIYFYRLSDDTGVIKNGRLIKE